VPAFVVKSWVVKLRILAIVLVSWLLLPGCRADLTVFRQCHSRLRLASILICSAGVSKPAGYTKEHFQSVRYRDDIALIKAMGFDHVRLSVNAGADAEDGTADEFRLHYLGYLDSAVKMILDQGMAVVIDLQPVEQLQTAADQGRRLVEHSPILAERCETHSSWTPSGVFDFLNEPEFCGPLRCYGVEIRLAGGDPRRRAAEHDHCRGANWSNDDDLISLSRSATRTSSTTPFLRAAHLYHQGATWVRNYWHWITAGRPILRLPNRRRKWPPQCRTLWRDSTLSLPARSLDAGLKSIFNHSLSWEERPVVCMSLACSGDSLIRRTGGWLRDVRTALEKHGMGWTMWDYAGSFGAATRERQATPDIDVEGAGAK